MTNDTTTKPDVKPDTKPNVIPTIDPFQPGPGTNSKPKAELDDEIPIDKRDFQWIWN